MTALERAARAVWDSVCLTNDDKSGGYVGTMRDKPFYVDGFVDPEGIARAVLMAVREPSKAMRVSGGEMVWDEPGRWHQEVPDYEKDEAEGAWKAMIDAILNEKDTTND